MPTDLNIWTPNGIVPAGDGNAAYDAGNSGVFSASAINTGGWNSGADPFNQTSNYNPVVNIPDQVIGGGSADNPTQSLVIPTATPVASNLFADNWMSDNMDLTYDIPPDGMQNISDWNSGADPFNQEENYSYVDTSSRPNPSPSGGGSGGGGGGGYSGPAPIPSINISQDLAQRQQTGNIYAPDLSAYNDSSLFNYTGPGGLDEYTYGQNLPYQGAGYDIWGSPTDVANPYYEGQYAPLPVGPADGAIGMSPVVMPPGIPPVSVQPPSSTNQPSMPGFTGGAQTTDLVDYINVNTGEVVQGPSIGGSLANNPDYQRVPSTSFSTPINSGGTGTGEKDLNYFETLAAMGIDPADAPSTTFPSPGGTVADKDYQDMLDKALAGTMDNQLQNQLDSSKPSSIMMDEQQNYEYDPYKGEAALNKDVKKEQLVNELPNQDFLSDDMDLSFDPNLEDTLMAGGSPNGRGGFDLYYDRDDVPKMTLDPNNLESNYLARDIAGGMAKNQAELMAKGQFLQDKYDAQEAIQNNNIRINAAEDAFQNQGTQGLPDKGSYAGSSAGLGDGIINTEHPAYAAHQNRLENAFQNQGVDADAYQRALEKERYQTQINNPTADFSGHMKNYGSGFKEPQASLPDVSSATPMQLAGSGSTLSGEQLNTRHPAYQAQLDRQTNQAENLFQNQGTEGLPNALKGSYAGSSAGLGDGIINTEHPAYQAGTNQAENLFQNQGTEGLPNALRGSYAGSSTLSGEQLNKGSYAGSSTLSGGQLNTQHPAYQAETNQAENLFQNQDTGGLPNELKGSYAGSSTLSGGQLNTQHPAYQAQLDRETNQAENLFQNQELGQDMSPGKVGLFNGIIEGLQNFGPNSERTVGEQKAWDKYYEYKNPAVEALNKGQIDEQAFNEIKGKVGSSTIVNHFIDRGDHPYINSLASNVANTFYQGVDVIAGDDSIMDGLIDLHQQGAGSNDQSKLGSVTEVIAKAKEATQQRKEVQENIFTPGPVKFAAVASKPKVVVAKPKPKPVVKSKPVRTPVKKAPAKVKVTKPVRTPVKKATVKKSSGPTKRKARGSYKKPAAKAVSTTFKRYGKKGGW